MQLLDPDEAAQTLATQAATNNTALFVTSPELVSSTHLCLYCLRRPRRLCKFLTHESRRQAGSGTLQSSIVWHYSLASDMHTQRHCRLQVTNGGLQLTGVTLDTTPVAGIYLVSCTCSRPNLRISHTRTFGCSTLKHRAKKVPQLTATTSCLIQAPPPPLLIVPNKPSTKLVWLYAIIGTIAALFSLSGAPLACATIGLCLLFASCWHVLSRYEIDGQHRQLGSAP